MKIAIMTQPLHNNYGGNLQNYALQKVLKDMGHQPLTIDRHKAIPLRSKLRLGYFKRLMFYFLGRGERPEFKYYFSKSHEAYLREEISRFIDAYINKTPRLYSDSQVQAAFSSNQFDAVVVGSDQCWRPIYSPNIYSYFLDFLQQETRIKKIAYAASFGTDGWEYSPKQTKRCKHLIQQFDLVTVREKAAVNLVRDKLEKNAHFVLDPTLLLTREDYEELFKAHNLPNNKGVYTYILDQADWKNEVVKTVTSKLGLEHYSSQHDEKNPKHKIPSIESWIKGFADADFVITDSFHGTVFALIFNKPFISLVNVNRGASRFESILGELGVENRMLRDFNSAQIDYLLRRPVNYEEVRAKLKSLQVRSIELLERELSIESDRVIGTESNWAVNK